MAKLGNLGTLSLVAYNLGLRLAKAAWGLARRNGGGGSGHAHELNVINDLVASVCEQKGIEVRPLPGGFLELCNGDKKSISFGSDFEFESIIAWRICGDKVLTSMLLEEHGLPVADYASFSIFDYDKALEAFKEMNKPIVVKPRTSTCHGQGVTTGIYTVRDFRRAFASAASFRKDVMVEEFIPGINYRFMVLNGVILSAFKRSPMHVVGDGKGSLKELIETDFRYHIGKPRPPMKSIVDDDCRQHLKNTNKTLSYIPAKDEIFYLKEVCNGGPVEDVTDILHDDFRRMAVRAAEVLKVKLCTVDFICGEITEPSANARTVINEVNTSPGLGTTGEPEGALRPNERVTEAVVEQLFH